MMKILKLELIQIGMEYDMKRIKYYDKIKLIIFCATITRPFLIMLLVQASIIGDYIRFLCIHSYLLICYSVW